MPEQKSDEISRDRLAELLNEDLSREYQAIIAYVVYSQVLKGAEYMAIAEELEVHAGEELKHALTIASVGTPFCLSSSKGYPLIQGTLDATLPASPSSTASGTVSLRATF